MKEAYNIRLPFDTRIQYMITRLQASSPHAALARLGVCVWRLGARMRGRTDHLHEGVRIGVCARTRTQETRRAAGKHHDHTCARARAQVLSLDIRTIRARTFPDAGGLYSSAILLTGVVENLSLL